MKIVVLGATGTSGRLFVEGALARGHAVTVLARSPEKLDVDHPQLSVVRGDATDADGVRGVVADQDAVYCALGSGKSLKPATIRREGTRRVIEALQQLNQRPHLVVLSSLGVGDSRPQISPLVRPFIVFMLRHPFADHEVQEDFVRKSGLPWTLLRPTSLGDKPATGAVRTSSPPKRVRTLKPIPRADVSAFALQAIEQRAHVGEAVTLTLG